MKIVQNTAMDSGIAMPTKLVLRDLIIEQWPIDRLIPYIRNARTHSDAQVAQVAASIL